MKYALTGSRGASLRRVSPRADGQRATESGFTLLETLTAITILAIALTSLLGSYSSGVTAARVSDDYTKAQILAQSLMAQASASSDRLPSSSRGSSGPFRWEIRVRPADNGLIGDVQLRTWALFEISTVVRWDTSRAFRLQTLKLARRPE